MSTSTLGLKDKSVVSTTKHTHNESASAPAKPAVQEHEQEDEQDMVSSSESEPTSIFLLTASYLLDVHALKFAEMSLAHELTSGQSSKTCPTYLVAEARLHMQRHMYQEASRCLKKALKVDIQNSNAWALLGHAHFLMGKYDKAQDAYQRTLGYVTSPVHIHLVHTRLADIYLKQEKVRGSRNGDSLYSSLDNNPL